MATQDNGVIRPAPMEAPGGKELLGRNRAGLQASLLLDGLVPQSDLPLERHKLQGVKKTIDEGKHPTLTRTTQSSLMERGTYWERDEFKSLKTAEQRRAAWEESTNKILKTYASDDRREEAYILKRIGVEVENGASGIYEEFFIQEKGEIGYFAAKVARKLSQEEITKHISLIQTLGDFYGKSSAEIARHLTEAVKNVGENYKEFEEEATKQFSPSMEGLGVLKGIEERAVAWEEKQKTRPQGVPQPEQPVQNQPVAEPSTRPVEPEPGKEQKDRLIQQADGWSETDSQKALFGLPNYDAKFVSVEDGAVGVFDGVGRLPESGKVAEAASTLTREAFRNFRKDIQDVNEAREEVRQVVKNVGEEIGRRESEQFYSMLADIKRNASGELSDEKFDEQYAHPRRMQTWAVWTKRQLDPNIPPDGINDELRDFINEHIEGATTASVVKIWQGPQGERSAIVANVGDSRVYHYSAADKKLKIITVDDNALNRVLGEARALELQETQGTGVLLEEALRDEKISLKQSDPAHYAAWKSSDYLQEHYPWGPDDEVEVPLRRIDSRGLTKTLPQADVEPNLWMRPVKAGDRIVVLSDGAVTSTSEMMKVLADPANEDAKKAAEALVQLAKRPHLDDDTTAVVINL